ncbi:unnamed protein product [Rotaria sordida]|uniref:EF-hand domain-containing protein n=1 Tax=Rotaria sordida TaxID=392033 RepID=A0A818KS61_9BILA|nr:unnamed protein product [Rotaria sordida]CAF0946137.1 unnamed protein product [Rotaria sordida]CAF3535566.1 unnamed protein product [Rotaria sordida]CAF3559918.1 unnamed protein product [Rotaria sordida]
MNKLTPSQERELRDAFDLFDKNHSGTISAKELQGVLKALNIKASDKETEKLMKQMDENNSGDIDFKEFQKAIAPSFFKKYSRHELLDAFKKFDTDGNGYLTFDELQTVLLRLNNNLKPNDIKAIMASLDTTGDEKISFDEFCKLFE